MDKTNIIIVNFKILTLPKLEIETNEAKKYHADLSEFKKVFCFPKNQKEWENASITASGFNLTWGSRFEVNVDQILDASESASVKRHA